MQGQFKYDCQSRLPDELSNKYYFLPLLYFTISSASARLITTLWLKTITWSFCRIFNSIPSGSLLPCSAPYVQSWHATTSILLLVAIDHSLKHAHDICIVSVYSIVMEKAHCRLCPLWTSPYSGVS